AADAHRLQAERLVLLAQPVEQRAEDAGARHPKGMAERDRAPVWIELLAERIDADAARRGDHLGRKRLVDLDYVDVVDAHLGPLQRLLRGVDGAQPHELGLER